MVWGLEKGSGDDCNVWGNWETGNQRKAMKRTNWTLQLWNWLVRNYTYPVPDRPKTNRSILIKINSCYSHVLGLFTPSASMLRALYLYPLKNKLPVWVFASLWSSFLGSSNRTQFSHLRRTEVWTQTSLPDYKANLSLLPSQITVWFTLVRGDMGFLTQEFWAQSLTNITQGLEKNHIHWNTITLFQT